MFADPKSVQHYLVLEVKRLGVQAGVVRTRFGKRHEAMQSNGLETAHQGSKVEPAQGRRPLNKLAQVTPFCSRLQAGQAACQTMHQKGQSRV